MPTRPTLDEIHALLNDGATTSLHLAEQCLDRIQDPAGEGARAFTEVHPFAVRESATATDRLRTAGVDLSPIMGVPISVKDLFDVAGQVTRAGSTVLADTLPARQDALAIKRLREAGAVLVGRTNMTEFAYSGVGLNPHYGTPASPYDRARRLLPGGSSSGAAVSVADGMAAAAIGTDTGGSVRIPAALCGLAGFKPTVQRVPRQGAFPLSQTFDSIGPLAPSVEDCITLDQIMRGAPVEPLDPFPVKDLRCLVPTGLPLDDIDAPVSAAFERALRSLSAAGARIHEAPVEAINNPDRSPSAARILSAEAYAIHRQRLAEREAHYDPRVAMRMMPARNLEAADYIDLLAWLNGFIEEMERTLDPYDVMLLPTTPIASPPIADLESSDEVYFKVNTLMLRNTCIVNHMNGCALSIPCHAPGDAPAGLMIAAPPFQDEKVLRVGLGFRGIGL